jgi:two-component system sensor histidine kinase ChvG
MNPDFRVPFHRRLWFRLLAVNALILFLPYFSLRVARTYERHLLDLMEEAMIRQGQTFAAALSAGPPTQPPGPPWMDGAAARILMSRMKDRFVHPRIWVFSADGRFVADSYAGEPEGFRERPVNRAFWALPEVRSALAGRYGSSARIDPEGKRVILTSVLPLETEGRVDGILCLAQPTGRVMAILRDYKGLTKRVFLWSALLAAAVTLFLSWSIVRPLNRLISRAGRVERGEWDASLDLRRGDEIGRLSAAFERMKEKLRGHLSATRLLALDLAHRFKTPLTSIRGAAEILEEDASLDPGTRSNFLRNIRQDALRLDALLNRLLLLVRIEDPEADGRETFDFGVLARGMAERFIPAAKAKGVTVAVEMPEGPLPFQGIPDLLEKTLENLLDNALHFTPAGGAVRVTVTASEQGIEATVADPGPGIPEADRERIFTRFFTTRPGGNGLGLAIARAAVEKHGGTLTARNRPGGGACFVIFIPTL